MPMGEEGSDKNSLSKPPARIFINVSFSGVMLFAVDEVVSMTGDGEREELMKLMKMRWLLTLMYGRSWRLPKKKVAYESM
jgi:hypothetical protein